MAANKSLTDDIEPIVAAESDEALDQAIDSLRGVLKSDQEGGLPETGFEMGADLGGDPFEESGDDLLGGDHVSDFGAPAFGGQIATSAGKAGSALNANLDLIMDIPIELQIILGSSRMQVSSLMNLTEGATIALDRKIGEPVDIVVNGRLIARGEITVLENDETRFGVKLIEVKSKPKA